MPKNDEDQYELDLKLNPFNEAIKAIRKEFTSGDFNFFTTGYDDMLNKPSVKRWLDLIDQEVKDKKEKGNVIE